VAKLSHEYHTLDNPTVSDAVYDSLVRELRELESKYGEFADPNSPVHRVGGEPLDKFEKVKHKSRMLSLNDAFGTGEVLKWEERIKKLLPDTKIEFFAELKLDGLAVSLI
jgi:DNA ligase (NAD+)